MRSKLFLAGFVLAALLFPLPAMADDSNHAEDDLGLWGTVVFQKDLPAPAQKGYLTLQVSPRLKDNIREMNQILLFPGVGYKVNKYLSLETGYAWVGIFNYGKDGEKLDFDAEHRIWEGFALRKEFGKLKAFHRTRLEERFIEGVDDAALRLRTMTGGRYFLGDSKWFLIGQDELMWNPTEHKGGPQAGFNQNRLFAGLGKEINENFRVEGGYQMQYVNRPSPADDQMNHIILVQVFYKLP